MKVAAYCSYIQVSPGRYWITTGINSKQSFGSVFEDADDGIESVRRKLDTKARFARQYSAIRTLWMRDSTTIRSRRCFGGTSIWDTVRI